MADSITSWPTEVLFSFFSSLEPLEFPNFAQVCKKWRQMSVDNELWRRSCERRWDVLPKEKDFTKNWLIPIREGGGDKEHRIDWRRVYLMRDLGEKAEEALLSFMPANKNNRAPNWMKELRKKKKKVNEPSGIFSQGWLSVKNLDPLNKQVQKSLTKMMGAIQHSLVCSVHFTLRTWDIFPPVKSSSPTDFHSVHNTSQAEEALDIFPFSDMLQLVTT
jgi:hypothetical protein